MCVYINFSLSDFRNTTSNASVSSSGCSVTIPLFYVVRPRSISCSLAASSSLNVSCRVTSQFAVWSSNYLSWSTKVCKNIMIYQTKHRKLAKFQKFDQQKSNPRLANVFYNYDYFQSNVKVFTAQSTWSSGSFTSSSSCCGCSRTSSSTSNKTRTQRSAVPQKQPM